ncbi:hypothetical protein GLOTRDRAFT_127971 [Gloeophyllum trabeum ATCC 11539]|uniref:Secreted protein n=1 Tax=Gloeophyllum trabeum (strain ATCC 11539 / FP-39264 / Madison 617) TaxID=670483 RepID=S7RWC8_GLOTA|nr:uncharacterized protein GLOTRDRAFT_127971 [Gloeophyllum trabeum ATCC 11539]EPQ57614.1 hypothetical protein GLOTRDRAFT_127971 [Gloeophyllum trabeum ATCC 11539]
MRATTLCAVLLALVMSVAAAPSPAQLQGRLHQLIFPRAVDDHPVFNQRAARASSSKTTSTRSPGRRPTEFTLVEPPRTSCTVPPSLPPV